jgi:hypothetical protein
MSQTPPSGWGGEIEALFRPMLLPVGSDAVRTAIAGRRDASAQLDTLRLIPLPYVPAYIEPLHALRWIERGGRGPEA